MNIPPETPAPDPTDRKLKTLLREAHPPLSLPPRFREEVWQRVERGRRLDQGGEAATLWEAFRGLWSRPAYAGVGLATVMVAGVWLGVRAGEQRARHADRVQYIASVSPYYRAVP